MNMKQIRLFLYAAISALAVASCAKEAELVEPEAIASGEKTVLTLSLGVSDTKTALVGGKTTWTAGDVIRVYNATGTYFQDVKVPAAATGLAAAEVEVNLKDSVYYAVYPAAAANGCSVNKVKVKLPNNPDGLFSSANICAAKSNGTNIQMRNLTAVLKVTVNSGNVVEILQINSKNAMNGACDVDLSGADPALTVTSSAKSATVAIGGVDGDYYVPVFPGKYDKEFSMTALRGNGGYQTLTSSQDNEIEINTIVPLGTIGDDLSTGLSGEGTEASPYKITNLGEYGAFAASVNLGNPYSGKFVALDADIEEAKTPIGHYLNSDEDFPFSGTFLGNNHVVNLNMDGDSGESPNYIAMFGLLGEGALVKDVKLTGKVVSSGQYIGGLAGYVRGDSDARSKIENCTNEASIEGKERVAGIAGYSSYADITSCTNKGELKAQNNVAGMVGYAYYTNVSNSNNSGAVTGTVDCGRVLILPAGSHKMTYLDASSAVGYNTVSTLGVGGISGWTQNSTIEACSNTAAITGVSKVAGIAGALFWSTSKKNTNSGTITASSDFAGGISGWNYTNTNNLEDVNSGSVSGRAAVGGIVGMTNDGISNGIITVKDCKNTGSVTSTGTVNTKFYNYGFNSTSASGGIIGLAVEYSNGNGDRYLALSNCTNDGSILGAGNAVGGIVGMRAIPLNNTQGGFIDNCVNNGPVESKLYRASGIVGVAFDRFENSGFEIRNCVNHGTIKAPYVVAGIVSWSSSAYPQKQVETDNATIRIINCLNDGDVLYDKTAYAENAGPYAAGIVGYNQKVRVYNSFNAGAVKPISGDPNEYDAKLRAEITSALGRYSIFNYVYSFKTGLPIATATSVNTPIGVVGDITAQVKETGEFEASVEILGKEYEKPAEALNAWIAGVTSTPALYLKWKDSNKGPVLE